MQTDSCVGLFIGTYTRDESLSRGIYYAELNINDGSLHNLRLVYETADPGFLALHPNGRWLYALQSGPNGQVKAFSIDQQSRKLTLLNRRSSEGDGPCHISLDRSGKTLLVANYMSGSAASYQLTDDGQIGPPASVIEHCGGSGVTERQQSPHAHSINVTPDNRFVYIADLGMDKVMIYNFSAESGVMRPAEVGFFKLPPGAGPRHLAFHPNGKFVYIINELGNSITAAVYDSCSGGLSELQTISTLPADFSGESLAAEVVVSADGHYLYGSNRGDDSIAIFSICRQSGSLTLRGFQHQGIANPRHFNLTPGGEYCLAGSLDNNLVTVYRVNRRTADLQPLPYRIEVGKPICIKFYSNPEKV